MKNEETISEFRKYLDGLPCVNDLCTAEQAVSIARLMAESIGSPLDGLTVARIKEFKRSLRNDARANPRLSEYQKALDALKLSRAFLGIEYFVSFRKHVLR
jgi:hypothetical protein